MTVKLSHNEVTDALNDIITESEHMASSGDVRLANEGRRNTLLATILLQIVSGFSEGDFNDVVLVGKYDNSEEVVTEDTNPE